MARYVKDAKDEQWEIRINVNTVRRIKDRTAGTINLFEPNEPENKPAWQLLYQDVLVWYDVLYATMIPQCDERRISEFQFGEQWAGDQIVEARDIFYEQWALFLQGLQKHEQALVVEAAVKSMTRAAERVKQEIASQDVVNRAVRQADKILNDSFGDLQGKLDSILGPTRCGS
jgi:hypothetical protein